ncbi:MAG: hypothetical protein MPK06_06145 [Alphaproteobacteria bacterium]|nr:hypothetical protein [Alphaproteobacteria bacterium]MDA8001023.1 hypothetical protein [Alphaproteobacteria bacterium]MDA8004611.1 hypothetical protein [Alphaproteobacteria bacterium]MDA8006100.1 hypothetical protein [Alphaproteobacteria bacterium]MDA8009807.1 hypothetical protein [Alphaproteobacteria bacterium]
MNSSISESGEISAVASRLENHEDICRDRYELFKYRFDQIDRKFEQIDRRFEAMQRILVVYGFLIAALVATTFLGVDLETINDFFSIVR